MPLEVGLSNKQAVAALNEIDSKLNKIATKMDRPIKVKASTKELQTLVTKLRLTTSLVKNLRRETRAAISVKTSVVALKRLRDALKTTKKSISDLGMSSGKVKVAVDYSGVVGASTALSALRIKYKELSATMAKPIKMQAGVTAEGPKVISELKNIANAVNRMGDNYARAAEASTVGLRKISGEETRLVRTTVKSTSAIEKEKKKIIALEKQLEDAAKKSTAAVEREKKKVIAIEKKLAAEARKSAAAMRRNNDAMNAGSKKAAAFRAGLLASGHSMGLFTASTLVAATTVYTLVKAIKAVITVGSQFEQALAETAAIMGTDKAGVTELTTSMLDLAETTKFTTVEIAKASTILARTGMKQTALSQALPSVLNLAAIGSMDMAKAADIASNSMFGFGLEAKDLAHVVDVLAYTSVNSNTSVERLGSAISYVAPLARATGQSLEHMSAMMGVMADSGIKGSRAGTNLRRALVNLVKPSEKMKGIFYDLGVSVKDSDGKLKDLMVILEELGKAGASEGDLAEIFGARAVAGILAVMRDLKEGIAGGTSKVHELVDGMAMVDGSAEKMRNSMEKNLIDTWKKFTSVLSRKATEAFLKVGDSISKLVVKMTDLAREGIKVENMFSLGEFYLKGYSGTLKTIAKGWDLISFSIERLTGKNPSSFFDLWLQGISNIVNLLKVLPIEVEAAAQAFGVLAAAVNIQAPAWFDSFGINAAGKLEEKWLKSRVDRHQSAVDDITGQVEALQAKQEAAQKVLRENANKKPQAGVFGKLGGLIDNFNTSNAKSDLEAYKEQDKLLKSRLKTEKQELELAARKLKAHNDIVKSENLSIDERMNNNNKQFKLAMENIAKQRDAKLQAFFDEEEAIKRNAEINQQFSDFVAEEKKRQAEGWHVPLILEVDRNKIKDGRKSLPAELTGDFTKLPDQGLKRLKTSLDQSIQSTQEQLDLLQQLGDITPYEKATAGIAKIDQAMEAVRKKFRDKAGKFGAGIAKALSPEYMQRTEAEKMQKALATLTATYKKSMDDLKNKKKAIENEMILFGKAGADSISELNASASGYGGKAAADKEIETLTYQYAAQRALSDKYRADELSSEQAFAEAKKNIRAQALQTDMKYIDTTNAGFADAAGFVQSVNDVSVKNDAKKNMTLLSQAAGFGVAMTAEAAKHSKKAFELNKKLQIAQLAINTGSAIMRAFAEFPWPVAVGASALIGTMAAQQYAMIQSTTYQGGGAPTRASVSSAPTSAPYIPSMSDAIFQQSMQGGNANNTVDTSQLGGPATNITFQVNALDTTDAVSVITDNSEVIIGVVQQAYDERMATDQGPAG